LFISIWNFKIIKLSLAAFSFVAAFGIIIPANADQNRTTELKEFKLLFQRFNKAKKSQNHNSMILFGERLTGLSLNYFKNDDFIIPIMTNYADALVATRNYIRAEDVFRKIINVSKTKVPVDWKTIVLTHAKLISVLRSAGRFEEAGRLQQAQPLVHKRMKLTAQSHKIHKRLVVQLYVTNNFIQQEQWSEAKKSWERSLGFYNRYLAMDKSVFGAIPAIQLGAKIYRSGGKILLNLGELDKAKRHLIHSIELFKKLKNLGKTRDALSGTFVSLNLIAQILQRQGDMKAAFDIINRMVDLTSQNSGNQDEYAVALNQRGIFYSKLNKFAEAYSDLKKAQKIMERDHPNNLRLYLIYANMGYILSQIGDALDRPSTINTANLYLKKSLKYSEKLFGDEGAWSYLPLLHLCLNSLELKLRDSITPCLRAKNNGDKFISDFWKKKEATFALARAFLSQGKIKKAYRYSRENFVHMKETIINYSFEGENTRRKEHKNNKTNFLFHASLSLHPLLSRERIISEAYEAIQLAQTSEAAMAMSKMASRIASSDAGVSSLLRKKQDLQLKISELEDNFFETLGKDLFSEKKPTFRRKYEQIKGLNVELKRLNERVKEEFPAYSAFMKTDPLSIKRTQNILNSNEAMVLTSGIYNKKLHVFVITPKKYKTYFIDISRKHIKKLVNTIRGSLDLQGMKSVLEMKSFKYQLAYELYDKLLGKAANLLIGKSHIHFVTSGELSKLPLGLLITKDPEKVDNYKNINWLIRRFSLSRLPSVNSLKLIREVKARSSSKQPFIGFGDPIFQNGSKPLRMVEIEKILKKQIKKLPNRLKLSELPDTADELKSIALFLGSDKSSLFLRERANETNVKTINLNRARIIAFATHAVMAGEINENSEPGIMLTPNPSGPNKFDDGFLSASEISQLKLNADWVILSACNTASGRDYNGESFSGLTKAFLYAGTRSLLVSHWSVSSKATVILTTKIFEALRANPQISHSEAHRRSMRNLALTKEFHHPAFWAAFSLVGDGANRKVNLRE